MMVVIEMMKSTFGFIGRTIEELDYSLKFMELVRTWMIAKDIGHTVIQESKKILKIILRMRTKKMNYIWSRGRKRRGIKLHLCMLTWCACVCQDTTTKC